MAIRRGRKPGPVGLGPRRQRTLRVPEATAATIENGAATAGYSVNEYVCSLLDAALAAGLAPPPTQKLPLSV